MPTRKSVAPELFLPVMILMGLGILSTTYGFVLLLFNAMFALHITGWQRTTPFQSLELFAAGAIILLIAKKMGWL